MSDKFDGIELKFKVTDTSITDIKNQIKKGLEKKTVNLSNFHVTETGVNSIRRSINKSFEKKALNVNFLNATQPAVRKLKQSINKQLEKEPLNIGAIKPEKIDLKNALITNTNKLREQIAEAISAGGYTLKITKVDASAAIKDVQAQLRAALQEGGFVGKKTPVQQTVSDYKAITEAKQAASTKQARMKYLSDMTKELNRISASADSKGLLGRSDAIAAKIKQIGGHIKYVTNNMEAFDSITRDVEKEIGELNAMIAKTNVPAIQNLAKSATNSNNQISSKSNTITDTATLSKLQGAWREIQNQIKIATDEAITFGEAHALKNSIPELEKMVTKYNEVVTLLKELKGFGISPQMNDASATPLGFFDVDAMKAQIDEAKNVAESMKNINKVMGTASKIGGTKSLIDSEQYATIEAHYEKIIALEEEYKAAASPAAKTRIAEAINKECAALEREVVATQKLVAEQNRLTRRTKTEAENNAKPADPVAMRNLAGQMQGWLNANSQAGADSRTSGYYKTIETEFNKLNSAIKNNSEVTKGKLKETSTAFKQASLAVKQFGVSGQTMFERFTKGFEKFGGWMLITSVLMEGITVIHTMVENVVNLDTAMTQLRKVTDETKSTYDQFYDVAVQRSKEIGATVSEMINATADFARLGYNITDAEGLAEVANIYMHVGDNIASIDDASQSIISTLKAFYNTSEDGLNQVQAATHIVDSFNEVGNNFAISSDGIGEALKRSASALKAAGNDVNESIGMITAINEVLQDPEKVGTVLKTTSMYLRSAKTELQDAGESTDGLVQSTAKLRDLVLALTNQKVDIMQDPDTIKSTYQVYKELSQVWGDMTDINRASLLEALGGKRNANATAALITNFKTAEEAMETATNSAGSAAKENERQMDSIEGKVRQLKASFEELSNSVLSSGLFKSVISGLTTSINLVSRLVDRFGALPTTLAMATAAWRIYNKAKDAAEAKPFGQRIQDIKSDTITGSGLFKAKPDRKIFKVGFNEDSSALKALGEIKKNYIDQGVAIDKLVNNINRASKAVEKYKSAAADAMNSNDFAGVMTNTDAMNEQREKLRNFYKNLQEKNPEMAAEMRGAFEGGMMGDGDQFEKPLTTWKKIKNTIGEARQKMVGLNVAEKAAVATATALNVSFAAMKVAVKQLSVALLQAMGAFAIGWVIQGVITLVDKIANRYKYAAEKAADVADKTREISDANKETRENVDSVIERYEQYGKLQSDSATKNAETRATLIGLQQELNDAVGGQASKIDLVNGKYDDQIKKLKELRIEQNKTQKESNTQTQAADIELSKANYKMNKSKNFDNIFFGDDKSAIRTRDILSESEYAKYFSFAGTMITPFIEGDEIESTIDQLNVLNDILKMLEKNGVDASDSIYAGLASDAAKLNSELGDTKKDAQETLDTIIEGEILSNPYDEGSQSLVEYRDNLKKVVKASGDVKSALDAGLYTQKDINQAIDEFVMSNYADAYKEQITPLKEIDEITSSLFGGKKGKSFVAGGMMDSLKKQIAEEFTGKDLEIAYSLILDKSKSFKGIKDLREAVNEELDFRETSDYVAQQLRESLTNVLNDENNKTDVKNLKKLAQTTGIKASDVEALAAKSEELTDILDENGISAEYLAHVLQNEFDFNQTGAGIASITGKALDLNKSLHGMEEALDRVAAAKAKYDAAMSHGNSDAEFRNSSEAFSKAFEAAKMGRTGSGQTDFWAGAEYLLGEDQLEAMGYNADAVANKIKELAPMLKNAETAGAGFIQKLQSMADESGNVVINGEKVATVLTDDNGKTTIDARAENFKKIADALGISEPLFTQSLNAAREWANVTTFSTEEVYNKLRDTGDVLDNTAGDFKKFSSAEIIDTKNLKMSKEELRQFKQELKSTGGNYIFMDLQSGADAAMETIKELGLAKEKVFSDGSGTGNYTIDTKGLNSLLAALGYQESEVRAVYDQFVKEGKLTQDDLSAAMEDYAKKADSSTGYTKKLKDAIESLKGKKIELEIEAKVNGSTLDPNDKWNMMPDTEAYGDFLQNQKINPHEWNESMQLVVDDITSGSKRAQDAISAMRGAIESSLDFDGGDYSEEYAQTWRDQMDVASQTMDALRKQGLKDTDQEMAEQKKIYNDALKGMLDYDKKFYDQQRSMREDAVSALQEDPFGDAVTNKDQILSDYRDIYAGAAQMREEALAKGYPPNSEFVRSLEAEMRKAISSMENARRDAFKNNISLKDLQADVLSKDRHDGESADGIVSIYKDAMSAISAEAARVRAEGASENNEYLIELKRQWYDYRDRVKEVQKEVYAEQAAWAKHQTTMLESTIVGSSGKSQLIGAYQNEQRALLQEISNLAAMGYHETDQEIYSLREQIASLNASIRETQKEVVENAAAFAKHNTTMAQYATAHTGDSRSMIGAWRSEQAALQQQISALAAMGYRETDQEIYSLREQIAELSNSIVEANAQWLEIQAQIDRREETIMDYYHSSPQDMMKYYDKMIQCTQERRNQLYGLGYGEFSSEVQSTIDEYWDYMQKKQDAYKEQLQQAIDVYDLYKKELEVGKYPFEEFVRVIYEERANVEEMMRALRNMGYAENSSEMVSLKQQWLEAINEIEDRASDAMGEIDRRLGHQIKMIQNNYTIPEAAERTIPLLKQQQREYHELAEQLRMLGYNEDSEVIQKLEEAWWDVQREIVNTYKETMDDIIAVSEHTVSMVFDRRNYSYQEYVNEYKRIQSELHATADKYREMGIDENDELIRDLQDQWWDYEDKVLDVFQNLVDEASKSIDALKGAYDDFLKAAEDYGQYGALSYDSFKAIIDLGPEYLSYITDTNGLLQINKANIKQVLAAKAEELAVDTALNYLERIREARMTDQVDLIDELTKGTQHAASATRELIYFQLKNLGLTQTQFEGAVANLDKMFSLKDQFVLDIDVALNPENTSSLDDLSGSFDDMVGYVEDMIKSEYDEMGKALDEQLKKYKDIVDKKKEALKLAKEEADYEEEVADQVKEIAKLQNQIDQLSLDDSNEARAKRAKLEEELANATKKLADNQRDHVIAATEDQLDADVKAVEESTDARKEAINDEVSSAEKLHRLAMDRIMQYGEQNLNKLLQEVLDWNLKSGNSLERNIKDTWIDINNLVERYGSLVGAIAAIRNSSLKDTVREVMAEGVGTTNTGSNDIIGRSYYNGLDMTEFQKVLDSMIENSMDWWTATRNNQRRSVTEEANENSRLSNKFKQLTGVSSTRRGDGRWYIDDSDKLLYDNQDVGKWVVAKMKENDSLVISGDLASSVAKSKNADLAKSLGQYTGGNVRQGSDGTWYYNGQKLYDVAAFQSAAKTANQNDPIGSLQDQTQQAEADVIRNRINELHSLADQYRALGYKDDSEVITKLANEWYDLEEKLKTYHSGGTIGKATLKQDEVMAKLQQGEMVLDKKRQNGLFKLVDLASYLSEKLGVNLRGKTLSAGGDLKNMDLDGVTKPTNQINSSVNFAPNINVTISGGVEDPMSAKKYAKSIADLTLGNLKEAFSQKGITRSLQNA